MKIEIAYTVRMGCYIAETTVNKVFRAAASAESYAAARDKLLVEIRTLAAAPALVAACQESLHALRLIRDNSYAAIADRVEAALELVKGE